MNQQDELRHVMLGPMPEDVIDGIGIVRFIVRCPGNSSDVLRKCREVLNVVLPPLEEWREILPSWFIRQCVEERTEEEDEKWLEQWRQLSPEQQMRLSKESRWSLSEWIAWFQAEDRSWYWWDAVIDNPTVLRVAVEVHEWPFPWGALDWLLRASGATIVEAET
jgi:hypothetical protein